jgi:transposase
VLKGDKVSRKKYTKEFKLEAVKRIIDTGQTQSSVARELGISESMVGRWVGQYRGEGEVAFPGSGYLAPAQEEIRRLQRENQRLKQERDILKKAISFFAHHEK